MRVWVRRLLPLAVLALVLATLLAGAFRRPGAVSGDAASSGPRTPAARTSAAADRAGPSGQVGPIPGTGAAAANHGALVGRPLTMAATYVVAPLHGLYQADLLALGPGSLSAGLLSRIKGMAGVAAAIPVDAGRLRVNGSAVNVLGIDPSAFRPFAAGPTARATALWRNVAAGGIAISYTMSQEDRLSLSEPVQVQGATARSLPIAGFGTVGVGDVAAVVSDSVAASLGIQSGNAIVISAPRANLAPLMASIKSLMPRGSTVAPLVSQVVAGSVAVTAGAAGALGLTGRSAWAMTTSQTAEFLAAARSRLGAPYVWGGSGPNVFDCSGLVYWSMARAGIVMPRVAADQARTGPLIPVSALRPGDLLFYHTDPTAPNYISHVAIYIGGGQMEQAPQPGQRVEIVPAWFGAGFAGAVQVYPAVAAQVAASPLG